MIFNLMQFPNTEIKNCEHSTSCLKTTRQKYKLTKCPEVLLSYSSTSAYKCTALHYQFGKYVIESHFNSPQTAHF